MRWGGGEKNRGHNWSTLSTRASSRKHCGNDSWHIRCRHLSFLCGIVERTFTFSFRQYRSIFQSFSRKRTECRKIRGVFVRLETRRLLIDQCDGEQICLPGVRSRTEVCYGLAGNIFEENDKRRWSRMIQLQCLVEPIQLHFLLRRLICDSLKEPNNNNPTRFSI